MTWQFGVIFLGSKLATTSQQNSPHYKRK